MEGDKRWKERGGGRREEVEGVRRWKGIRDGRRWENGESRRRVELYVREVRRFSIYLFV
jgi:hypothetical protein